MKNFQSPFFSHSVYLGTLCFLFFCCSVGTNSTKVVATKQNFGNTILMNRNDTLLVQLPGNPDSGYMWHAINMDTFLLKPDGFTFTSDSVNKSLISGTYNFMFIADNPGVTTLQMLYERAWVIDYTPKDSFRIVLDISDNN